MTFKRWRLKEDCQIEKIWNAREVFLIHVARTYPVMTPYLKGLHQTIDGWRKVRDEDGWKRPKNEVMEYWDENQGMVVTNTEDSAAPESVLAASRLKGVIECLAQCFAADDAPV